MAKCLKHEDREAVVFCGGCGKPMCEECAVFEKFCSARCMEAGKKAAIRSEKVLNERSRTNASKALRKFIFIVITMGLAVFAGWYYWQNKKTIDHKARQILRKADKANQDMFESAKHKPLDSKYKRDRENLVR